MKNIKWAALFVAAISIFVIAGCAPSEPAADKPAEGAAAAGTEGAAAAPKTEEAGS
jgi:hypothetical protein